MGSILNNIKKSLAKDTALNEATVAPDNADIDNAQIEAGKNTAKNQRPLADLPGINDVEEHPEYADHAMKEEDDEVNEDNSSLDLDTYKVVAESLDVEDDLNAIFGDTELTEEFKERTKTIFEAAVTAKVNEILQQIVEDASEVISEEVEAAYDLIAESVDLVVEEKIIPEWFEENATATQKNVRNEVMESFIAGLKTLFEQHYIDVPEESTDLLVQVSEENEQLVNELNEEVNKNIILAEELKNIKKHVLVSEATKGLSDNQAEKLKLLSEAIDYDTDEDLCEKIEELKEAYFTRPVKKAQTEPNDVPVLINEEKKVSRFDEVRLTSDMISRMFPKN